MGAMVLLSNPRMHSLTFFSPEHPRTWVGYRVREGQPEIQSQLITKEQHWPSANWGEFPIASEPPLVAPVVALPRKRWRTAFTERDSRDASQLIFQSYRDGSAFCSMWEDEGKILREYYFRPVTDGMRMWLRLTTEHPIQSSYLVQQCLRFTGAQNWSMRRNIANVPFLSELDVQAMGHPELTLTYLRLGDEWFKFPPAHAIFATPLGTSLTGHEIVGLIDHGPIVRETLDRKTVPASYFRKTAPGETWGTVSSGMYWERTVWVSNRQPADCVHSMVDLGPLNAGESRTVRGKFYWIEGSKDDLLAAWQRDFPS